MAYEQRRKLAMRTMREMKTNSQRANANVNRQARAAIASLPITETESRNIAVLPESLSTSKEEEPMLQVPQQAQMPVMSICEDSELTTLMSARNPITIQDMSPIVPEQDPSALEDRQQMNQTMQTKTMPVQEQNPFLATPNTDSINRETMLE